MRRVFADIYVLLALLNERDAEHARVGKWLERLRGDEIITTAWVLMELADGMSRGHSRRVYAGLIEDLRSTQTIEIIQPAAALLWRGFDLYRQREDKEWSLTDCIPSS
jgi:predicted nucleic acid-binding protein